MDNLYAIPVAYKNMDYLRFETKKHERASLCFNIRTQLYCHPDKQGQLIL
jgi:hypothetical protein